MQIARQSRKRAIHGEALSVTPTALRGTSQLSRATLECRGVERLARGELFSDLPREELNALSAENYKPDVARQGQLTGRRRLVSRRLALRRPDMLVHEPVRDLPELRVELPT